MYAACAGYFTADSLESLVLLAFGQGDGAYYIAVRGIKPYVYGAFRLYGAGRGGEACSLFREVYSGNLYIVVFACLSYVYAIFAADGFYALFKADSLRLVELVGVEEFNLVGTLTCGIYMRDRAVRAEFELLDSSRACEAASAFQIAGVVGVISVTLVLNDSGVERKAGGVRIHYPALILPRTGGGVRSGIVYSFRDSRSRVNHVIYAVPLVNPRTFGIK